MKIPPLLLALLITATPALANDVIPVLKTANSAGTLLELREVRVIKVEPDGLRVMHSAGTAKVPFERLPDDLLAKYNINADSARQHRQDSQAATAAAPTPAAAATTAATTSAAPKFQSGAKLVTKDDVKTAWLRECETCFICPRDPQGAAKRQAVAQRVATIRSGAWDATAEQYARQANIRSGAIKQ